MTSSSLSANRIPGVMLRLWLPLLAVLLVLAVSFRISVTANRYLDVDELEHLNAAYAIGHGETLYGSLFENHPPLLVWSLQPIVRSGDDAEAMIRTARWWMLLPCLGLLALVARLGQRFSGIGGALAAPLFLLSAVFFFEKSVEVRPDVPGAFFMVLAFMLAAKEGRQSWIAAGAAIGVACFFTPKALPAILGAMAGLAAHDWFRESSRGHSVDPDLAGMFGRMRRLVRLGWIGLGTAAVALGIVIILVMQGAWRGFWRDCVVTSARMTIDHPGWMRKELLSESMLRGDPGLWIAGLLGAAWLFSMAWRARGAGGDEPASPGSSGSGPGASFGLDRAHGRNGPEFSEASIRWEMPLSLAAGLVGFFVIGAPLRQYFLFFLPQLAVLAAALIVVLVRSIRGRWLGIPVALAVTAAMLVPPWTMILPVQRQGAELEVLRNVLAETRPDQRVLDFWTGLYLTRLPAYRYFFLNSDVQRLLSPGQLERDLERVLDDPRVAVVIVDNNFPRLPKSVRQRIRTDFTPEQDFGFAVVMKRRGP